MVRGRTGKERTETFTLRLTPEERARWEAVRATSGRKEMGAWARAVIEEAVGLHPPGEPRPGDVPRVPEINAKAYAVLIGAANNLNQLTRYSHHDRTMAAGIARAIAEVIEAARVVRGQAPRYRERGSDEVAGVEWPDPNDPEKTQPIPVIR